MQQVRGPSIIIPRTSSRKEIMGSQPVSNGALLLIQVTVPNLSSLSLAHPLFSL